MKIDPRIQFPGESQPDRVKTARNGGSKSQGAANPSGVSSASGEDTVSLSSTQGETQMLAANLAKVPEVRTGRVQSLQQRVRSGQYQPDSQQVADAMIKDHAKVNAKA